MGDCAPTRECANLTHTHEKHHSTLHKCTTRWLTTHIACHHPSTSAHSDRPRHAGPTSAAARLLRLPQRGAASSTATGTCSSGASTGTSAARTAGAHNCSGARCVRLLGACPLLCSAGWQPAALRAPSLLLAGGVLKIAVEGMMCDGCSSRIEAVLKVCGHANGMATPMHSRYSQARERGRASAPATRAREGRFCEPQGLEVDTSALWAARAGA
jgi:hypothetical protein